MTDIVCSNIVVIPQSTCMPESKEDSHDLILGDEIFESSHHIRKFVIPSDSDKWSCHHESTIQELLSRVGEELDEKGRPNPL